MASCGKGTNEIAEEISELERNEITEEKEEWNEIMQAKEVTDEIAESKTDKIRRKLKEENGVVALKRLFVKKIIYMQEKAQRTNALDAKFRMLHRECCKISVEWFIDSMRVGAIDRLSAKLDLFSNEYTMLLAEYAKSVVELSIKKMRLRDLEGKPEKSTILELEIAQDMMMKREHMEILMDFRKKLRANALAKKKEPTEFEIAARVQLKKMETYLCDEAVRNINEIKASAFVRESLRVLMEMMKGVKCREKRDPRVEEAIALVDTWTVSKIDMCVVKVCVGVLVHKHSIYQVLKREIAETRKIDEEVMDRLVMYQWKYGHQPRAEGFATVIVVKENSEVDNVLRGDKRKEVLIDKFGLGLLQMTRFVLGAVAGIIAVTALSKGKG